MGTTRLPRLLRYNPSIIRQPLAALPVTRRFRPIVAVLLALLLVLMQQGAQLHALQHDNDWLLRPHDTGLRAPASDASCAICALFAAGADAAAADTALLPAPALDYSRPPRANARVAIASPSPYQSRAPPPTLC